MNKFLLAAVLLSTQGACATLFSGTKQWLAVRSEPSGAGVFIDERYYGDTPLDVQVDRGFGNRALTLKKAGHADMQTQLVSRFNPVAFINLVEPVGWVVDAISGATMK